MAGAIIDVEKPKKKTKPKKPAGLKADGSPNKRWLEFIERIENYSTCTKPHEHVFGYFANKFKQHYGVSYSYSFGSSPTKCPEIYAIKRMMANLSTTDIELSKKYIDFFFKERVNKGLDMKSLAILWNRDICLEFKIKYRKSLIINSNSKLTQEHISIVNDFGYDFETYGDLSFAWLSHKQSPEQFSDMFDKLIDSGLNSAALDRIVE